MLWREAESCCTRKRFLGKSRSRFISRRKELVWSGVGVGACLHIIPKTKAIAIAKYELTLNYFDSAPDTRATHSRDLSGMHPFLGCLGDMYVPPTPICLM